MPKEDRPVLPLKEWRKHLYLTQKELAEKLGVKLTTLRTWEQRTSRPHPAAHRKLAEFFHIEPGQISFDAPHTDTPKDEAAGAAA